MVETPSTPSYQNPGGIAADVIGDVYIGDKSNNVVRKISSTGIITTVAGGNYAYSGCVVGNGVVAIGMAFNAPEGVALDSSGNLYIADSGNNSVCQLYLPWGRIYNVAGNGTAGYSGDGGAATSAELNAPVGAALDSSGNIYIADEGNSRIRKVTVTSGKISTVAGNGTAGYSGDGGAATSAELKAPYAVALDTSGNIYIADEGNNRIRKVATGTGIITTVAGNGTAGYSRRRRAGHERRAGYLPAGSRSTAPAISTSRMKAATASAR